MVIPETELRQRDASLGIPTQRIGRSLHPPDRIPGGVFNGPVVADHEVVLHPGGSHDKGKGRAAIVERIELDADEVAIGIVAARQAVDDAVGGTVESPDADIYIIVVEEHREIGFLVRGAPSTGWCWVNSSCQTADCQAGSLRRPSTDNTRPSRREADMERGGWV